MRKAKSTETQNVTAVKQVELGVPVEGVARKDRVRAHSMCTGCAPQDALQSALQSARKVCATCAEKCVVLKAAPNSRPSRPPSSHSPTCPSRPAASDRETRTSSLGNVI
jgi:hypothetical protein